MLNSLQGVYKKKFAAALLIGFLLMSGAGAATADAVVGDTYVTLGENLSLAQKDIVYSNLNIEGEIEESHIIYVTNEEEHQYLGEYIPKMQIGTQALSSSKIEIGEQNSGLIVSVDSNINYITGDMYVNALSTAGVTDVKVEVSAPFSVSGTAALTGIIKAYELSTGIEISEEQKQIANEEMVTTAKLTEEIEAKGSSDIDLTELINKIKKEVNENPPGSDEELLALIKRLANENGFNLTDEQIEKLVSLFNKIKGLDVDWEKVSDSISDAKDKFVEFTESEEGKNFIQGVIDFIKTIVSKIGSFFSK